MVLTWFYIREVGRGFNVVLHQRSGEGFNVVLNKRSGVGF